MLGFSLDMVLAFAAFVVAIIGVIVAIIGVFYTRLTTTKRELLVMPRVPIHLLRRVDNAVRISVLHDGQPIAEPYVTVLRLLSTGRSAIATEHFDQNRPLLVDVGVPIVDLLQVNFTNGGFAVQTRGTTVAFGPDLLARGDVVETHLLTDGEPMLSRESVSYHLIDTSVEFVEPGSVPVKRRRQTRGMMIGAGIVSSF